ncbi:hypothetical protein TNCV_1830061 [Trichonephila clavipes]|nr:hypothetical protein TNCV_1830061 [Trichonephila clavipes]
MLSDKCTWSWYHCLLFDLGQPPTPRLAVMMVKREPAPIDNRRSPCMRRTRAPRQVSKEWIYRTKEDERRELEESPKEKRLGRWRTEIGVERKERRLTPVASENWNEWFKDMSECPSEKGLNSRYID